MAQPNEQPTRSKPLILNNYPTSFSPHRVWSDPLAGFEIKWRLNWMKQMLRGPKMIAGGLMLLAGVMLLGGTALSGCAPRLIATEVVIPSELRGPCDRTPLPPENPDASVNELLVTTEKLSLSQEADLNVCEAEKLAQEAIVDNHNRNVRKATCPWYRFGFC